MRHVNLDELEKAAHTVTKAGVSYRVRPVTARIAGIVKAAEASSTAEDKMRLYYDAVALLVPTMARDEVDDLSAGQLVAIVELAGTEVTAVDEAAALPNAVSPAPVARPAPGKKPRTRSAKTPSAASS
jgi:hypothetical protein